MTKQNKYAWIIEFIFEVSKWNDLKMLYFQIQTVVCKTWIFLV